MYRKCIESQPDCMLTQKNGTAVPSFLTKFMEKQGTSRASEEMEKAMQDVAFTTYAGMIYAFHLANISRLNLLLAYRSH